MIDKKTWTKLQKKWLGKIYQRPNERVIQRLKWFSKKAKLLKGLNVLEIGCNAGLMAVDANKYVESYLGLERKEKYYQQALITKEVCKLEKCEFIKSSIGKFSLKPTTNAVILSRVLYHLWEDEIGIVRKMLESSDLAIVICGKKGKGRTHNSYNFAKKSVVKKFFEEIKMTFKVDYEHDRFFCGVANND